MNEHDMPEPPANPAPTGDTEHGLHPALAAAIHAERERPADPAPENTRVAEPAPETERSLLATHRDPSTTGTASLPKEASPARGARATVSWVRPTDLIAQGTAKVAAVGIDLQTELTRRLRAATGDAARRTGRAVSDRAQRLPDLARQHRRPSSRTAAERSGMGPR